MAIKQEAKEALKNLGIDPDKLIAAVTATEETDIELPTDVTVLKTADLETRDANKLSEGRRAGELEGEKKGKELAAKSFKRKFGLADDIPADLDKVAEAAKALLDKGDPGMRSQVDALLKDKESLTQQIESERQKAAAAMFDADLIASLPAERDKSKSDKEWLALLKMNLEFEKADTGMIVKRGGAVVQHPQTHAPLPMNDAIAGLFAERGWVEKKQEGGGGRGAGDSTPPGGASGIKTFSKFQEKYKSENPGKDINGPEFQAAVAKHAKETADFNMYE